MKTVLDDPVYGHRYQNTLYEYRMEIRDIWKCQQATTLGERLAMTDRYWHAVYLLQDEDGIFKVGSSPEFVGEFGQFCPSFPPREEGVVSTEQRRDLRFELFP